MSYDISDFPIFLQRIDPQEGENVTLPTSESTTAPQQCPSWWTSEQDNDSAQGFWEDATKRVQQSGGDMGNNPAGFNPEQARVKDPYTYRGPGHIHV